MKLILLLILAITLINCQPKPSHDFGASLVIQYGGKEKIMTIFISEKLNAELTFMPGSGVPNSSYPFTLLHCNDSTVIDYSRFNPVKGNCYISCDHGKSDNGSPCDYTIDDYWSPLSYAKNGGNCSSNNSGRLGHSGTLWVSANEDVTVSYCFNGNTPLYISYNSNVYGETNITMYFATYSNKIDYSVFNIPEYC